MAYVLRGRKGGTVRFIPLENGVIEKESESYSSSVTSNPVEDGADIDDHVNNAAGRVMRLSVVEAVSLVSVSSTFSTLTT